MSEIITIPQSEYYMLFYKDQSGHSGSWTLGTLDTIDEILQRARQLCDPATFYYTIVKCTVIHEEGEYES